MDGWVDEWMGGWMNWVDGRCGWVGRLLTGILFSIY